MIIADFTPFPGQHCETTATGSLLRHLGVHLSEPLLFGLGEGLSFIYWDQRGMELPFIGGRSKPDQITARLAANLRLDLAVHETASPRLAWEHVRGCIDRGVPVGLKLDCFYLDYFSQKIHFAGHYVALYGYDAASAYLVDTAQQGGAVSVPLESLAAARNAKGPMSSRNRSYVLAGPADPPDLPAAIRAAIRRNAADYLAAPIANAGARGIAKTSREISKWPARGEVGAALRSLASIMERGGTGGALFRNLYRDFLGESLALVDDPRLEAAYGRFCQIAPRWSEVAQLIG
ncbi:MAG TPA: BtrH N-terminal domain-containing protein, partial [Herpetosiphonaceae bacterium]|nr:BtrH N-terminal domain-containing protein [Herpetosiphonaceae bacterium]